MIQIINDLLPENVSGQDSAPISTIANTKPYNLAVLCTIDPQARYYTPGIGGGNGSTPTNPTPGFDRDIIEEPENPTTIGFLYLLDTLISTNLDGFTRVDNIEDLVTPDTFYVSFFSEITLVHSSTEVTGGFTSSDSNLFVTLNDFLERTEGDTVYYVLFNLNFTSIELIDFGGLIYLDGDTGFTYQNNTLTISASTAWKPCSSFTPIKINGVSQYQPAQSYKAITLTYITNFFISYIDSISYKGITYTPFVETLDTISLNKTLIFDPSTKTALCIWLP